MQKRGSHCTGRAAEDFQPPVPQVGAVLSPMATESSEDSAGPRLGRHLPSGRGPCDGGSSVPRRGQRVAVAKWVRRALPSSYRRLSPDGLGESLSSAPAPAQISEMEKCHGGEMYGAWVRR